LSDGVEPSAFRRRVTPVRCASSGWGPAELIVGDARGGRAVAQVLEPAAPTVVAHEDVELAVGAERDHAAVVVPSRRLRGVALAGRNRSAVVLKRPEHDQVAVEHECGTVPAEAVDPVAEEGHRQDVSSVRAELGRLRAPRRRREERIVGWRWRRAARPEEIDAGIGREVRVQRDPEQPSLGRVVHSEIEHGRGHHTVRHPLHLAGVLFECQKVVRSEERDAGREREPAEDGADLEVGSTTDGAAGSAELAAVPKSERAARIAATDSRLIEVPPCCVTCGRGRRRRWTAARIGPKHRACLSPAEYIRT
jgi:hypothetical protein